MNALIETLNRFGENALHFAWPMFWQSSVLIAILFVADLILRRRVRAAVRYALWLVLLVKLLLPPSLALPTGVTWWLLPATATANPHATRFVVRHDADAEPGPPPQPAPPFTAPQPPMSASAWTILAWVTISAGLFVWLTARWQQVTRDVRRATPVPAWLGEMFDEVKSSTGLRRTVHLRVTNQAMSPAVCGLFQPVILLPQSLVQKLPPVQLRAVLLHELTHLRRGDVWMNCAQALVQIVYWWHPLLWLANAHIRRVREEAVDDAVMLALRDDAEAYAPTLLEVAKLAYHRPLASLGLVGILESRSALRQRIDRLMDFHAPRRAGLTLVSLCGICIFSAVAVPMGEALPTSPDASKNTLPTFSGITNKPASSAGVSTNLSTRTFKVDTNVFLANFRNQIDLQTNFFSAFKILMSSIGVNLSAPKSFYFNETRSVLFMHATEQDLDKVEKVLSILDTLQIHIKARFVELPGSKAADLYLGSFNTSTIYPAPDDIPQPTRETINRPKSISWTDRKTLYTGIMTESQFRAALHAMQSNPDSESLAEPEVTTLSGRQTQMRATDFLTIITNFVFQETSTNSAITPQQSQVEVGPVLDVIPVVLPDGYTIDLTAIPSLTEFLGYDKPPTNSTPVVTSKGAIVNVPNILPRFRVRQAVAHLKLWDNQTVVLGSLPDRLVPGGKEVDAKPGSEVHKQLLVFVTVTLVDRAGNRIHSDEEVARKQHSAAGSP